MTSFHIVPTRLPGFVSSVPLHSRASWPNEVEADAITKAPAFTSEQWQRAEAFRRYRRTEEWAGKAPRTREDWWRGWKRTKPIFSDCDPRTVTLEDLSAWRKAIEETVSLVRRTAA